MSEDLSKKQLVERVVDSMDLATLRRWREAIEKRVVRLNGSG